ncbi:cytochrome P450 [Tanacetum coccineum]
MGLPASQVGGPPMLEAGEAKGESGFILDGFPRTIRQASQPVEGFYKDQGNNEFLIFLEESPNHGQVWAVEELNIVKLQGMQGPSLLHNLFLFDNENEFQIDVHVRKAVCNEKCKHGLRRDGARPCDHDSRWLDTMPTKNCTTGYRIRQEFSMNILSLNIRGFGEDHKRSWVRRLCLENKIHFLGLQESMSNEDNRFLIQSMWGHSTFDYALNKANGKSGGIVAIWDTSKFHMTSSIIGDGFLALTGKWLSIDIDCLFIVVYAPQALNRKKKLCLDIEALVQSENCLSVVMGDFNEVPNENERLGSHFCR